MVLKAGAEGEIPCILGTTQDAEELKPGEVRLTGPECSLHLGQGQVEMTGGEGSVRLGESGLELSGGLRIDGRPLEEIMREIAEEVARSVVSQMVR